MSGALPSHAPIRAVLLDMGGVLLHMRNESGLPEGDADAAGRAELLALLRERGGRADEDDLERLLFAPWRIEYARRYELQREADWRPHVESLIRATGARVSTDEVLASWFRPYGAGLRPLDGAAATLLELRARGLALGLVSNVALPGALYRERLAAYDLAEPFTALRFSFDAGSRKPAPVMLLSALDELGASPPEAVMVGDRKKSDVAAGHAAGVRTVWLRSHHAEGPAPDVTIDALAELPAVLARL
ncbi:MAG TPA: HAD family hydrolase [Thermoanaerobaculia bacterium]|jgi:HAD superfamily hydrolase (TIGR01509 family)|nr:HAD family hydrolase [Thermoanaerobaculia bacterium]